MHKFFEKIVEKKIIVIVVFASVSVLSLVLATQVSVNYDLVEYLPDSSNSTLSIDILSQEFKDGVPNAEVAVSDVTIPQALEIKAQLSGIDGINNVLWLDNEIDIRVPLETQDADVIDNYYDDGKALFRLSLDSAKVNGALAGIRELLGDDIAMRGSKVSTAVTSQSSNEEVGRVMMFTIPLTLLILFLTTSSFVEPGLFMTTIGIAILINTGTNALFGEISFVTKSAQSILQMAVSMDYSIFLLHRFADFRKQGIDAKTAMIEALKKAFSSVTASGLTTAIGFGALILMRFKIGADMGVVMAKAIVISMACTLILLPGLALLFCKWIDKTYHRPFLPSFKKFSRGVFKLRLPITILALIIVVPCILAQQSNTFLYGSSEMIGKDTDAYRQQAEIEETFGKTNQMVLMVPKGDTASEAQMSEDIKSLATVSSVISYTDVVGATIPIEFVGEDNLTSLISENYSRLVIVLDTEYESKVAYSAIEEIREIAQEYFPEENYLAGDSASTYDMRTVVSDDMLRINLITIGAIFLVLLLTFKSISIPLILVFVIEASIWTNLSVPYFAGEEVFFLVYLIICAVQLGATVDYAILFANRYFEERALHDKKTAVQETIRHTIVSILTSASLLGLGSLMLGLVSSNNLLTQMGLTLARGAALSAVLVLVLLPALLYFFDGIIKKTTLKLNVKN